MSEYGFIALLQCVIALAPCGNDLLDYLPSREYWKRRGGAPPQEAILSELRTKVEGVGRNSTGTEKAAVAVRRLMCIRALGETESRESLPVLRGLLDSGSLFVHEYAAEAIARIEGKQYSRHRFSREDRRTDLGVIPAKSSFLCQASASALFLKPAVLDFNKKPWIYLDWPGKDNIGQYFMDELVGILDRLGNVRIHGITIAKGEDGVTFGGNDYVTVVVNGLLDNVLLREFLREHLGEPDAIESCMVFRWETISIVPHSETCVVLFRGSELLAREVCRRLARNDGCSQSEVGFDEDADDLRTVFWARANLRDVEWPPGETGRLESIEIRGTAGKNQDLDFAGRIRLGEGVVKRECAKLLREEFDDMIAALEAVVEEDYMYPVVGLVKSVKIEEVADGVNLSGVMGLGLFPYYLRVIPLHFMRLDFRGPFRFWYERIYGKED